MTAKQKKNIEYTLKNTNNIHGKGSVIAVIWGQPHSDCCCKLQGIAIRQFQYGMDGREFTVSADLKTVRFLQHTRPVIAHS